MGRNFDDEEINWAEYWSSMRDGLDTYEVGTEITVFGICRNPLYLNEDSGYGVFNFEDENEEHFCVQGTFGDAMVSGGTYKLKGKIVMYRGEKQLKVTEFKMETPSSKKGIISYLQTLNGLKTRAEDIYKIFGNDSINILLKDPMQIANTIKGIGKKSVESWQKQLELLQGTETLMVTLLSYGLTHKQAIKLIKEYDDSILEKIQNNPYFLIDEVKGFGFLSCDKIALEMGILPDNEFRIQQGIIHCLKKATESGDCFLLKHDLVFRVRTLLQFVINREEMKNILEQQLEFINKYHNRIPLNLEEIEECYESDVEEYCIFQIENTKIYQEIDKLEELHSIIIDDTRIYLRDYYFFETQVTKDIKRLAVYRPIYKRETIETLVDNLCKKKGVVLEKKQREAVIEFNLYQEGLFVLTGSAGTGKTFTLKLIVAIAELLKKKVGEKFSLLVTAPTGKAAKVASEALGISCMTLHRALNATGEHFLKNSGNPLEENFFICDETSMLDIELAYHYFSAIPTGKKVILVGDVKQLESIGPGNVLKDIISSKICKTIELDVSKRQGENSGIIYNANKIIAKEMIETTKKTKDFYIKKATSWFVADTVVEEVEKLMRKFDFNDIQVLIPQRTGSGGVNYVNYLLQQKLNPIEKKEEKVYKNTFQVSGSSYNTYIHRGDKVMHIKNNYNMMWYESFMGMYVPITNKIGITNGESGVVEEVTKTPNGTTRVIVKYDDGYVFYDEGVDELELCYATTIHKSQGSAWKAIILVISKLHTFLLTNNLFYTGVTRAREYCKVIGDDIGIEYALKTVKEIRRKTYLEERLRAL